MATTKQPAKLVGAGYYTMTWNCTNCKRSFEYNHDFGSRAVQPPCIYCGVKPPSENRWEDRYKL